MPKYTASIFLIAVVFCCSSLASPHKWSPSDEVQYHFDELDYDSDEFIPTDEAKLYKDVIRERNERENKKRLYNDELTLQRDSNKNKVSSSKKPKRAPDTKHDEAAKMAAAADITSRAQLVDILVSGVKESERESLRQTLDDAASNQHWNSIEDFITYGLKEAVKANLHSEGIEYDVSGLDLFADSSDEA